MLGRALTRDAYSFQEMPLVMSWISLGHEHRAVASAPTLGGFLGEWLGWRATFWFVGGFGIAPAAGLAARPARDQPNIAATASISASLLRGSGEMLRDRHFLGNVLTLGFAFAINFGMLAGVPFILQDRLGFSPREFGLIVLLSVGGFTAGTLVNNRLVGRVPPIVIMRASGWFHVGGSVGHGDPFALAASSPGGPSSVRTWC